MIVEVTPEYRIKSDSTQWTVQRYYPKAKKPQDQWKSESYHLRLKHALGWMLDRVLMDSPWRLRIENAVRAINAAEEHVVNVAYSIDPDECEHPECPQAPEYPDEL